VCVCAAVQAIAAEKGIQKPYTEVCQLCVSRHPSHPLQSITEMPNTSSVPNTHVQ
jgi:hypothetical protein